MNEQDRLGYLRALGIDVWKERGAADGDEASSSAVDARDAHDAAQVKLRPHRQFLISPLQYLGGWLSIQPL